MIIILKWEMGKWNIIMCMNIGFFWLKFENVL